MNIGIVGLGAIGSAIKLGFEKVGHNVIGYDIAMSETIFDDILETDIVYICVPTPQDADGSCDISIVESVADELHFSNYKVVIAIKSTVKPGTTQKLITKHKNWNICFVPEFLRERSPFIDFVENHTLLAIGTSQREVYNTVVSCHDYLPQNIVMMAPIDAEVLKYYQNIYNALRVIFANEMYEVCNTIGANYGDIYRAFKKRGTSTGQYLMVNDKWRGYGGVCLPKDTKAFAHLVDEIGLDLSIFRMIVDENKKFETTVPDGMRL